MLIEPLQDEFIQEAGYASWLEADRAEMEAGFLGEIFQHSLDRRLLEKDT